MSVSAKCVFKNDSCPSLLNFDRILEIDDSFYNALIYKAQLLVDLHRYDEAIICFDKCGDKLSADSGRGAHFDGSAKRPWPMII